MCVALARIQHMQIACNPRSTSICIIGRNHSDADTGTIAEGKKNVVEGVWLLHTDDRSWEKTWSQMGIAIPGTLASEREMAEGLVGMPVKWPAKALWPVSHPVSRVWESHNGTLCCTCRCLLTSMQSSCWGTSALPTCVFLGQMVLFPPHVSSKPVSVWRVLCSYYFSIVYHWGALSQLQAINPCDPCMSKMLVVGCEHSIQHYHQWTAAAPEVVSDVC